MVATDPSRLIDATATDTIAIEGLRVECIVGLYPHERDRPQRLVVDVWLTLDTRGAGAHDRLSETIDYASIAAQITFVLETCRFRLLESAAHALAALLAAPPPPGERRAPAAAVRIQLTKPEALGGNGIASLTITRRASEITTRIEEKEFGTVDVLVESSEAGIYRLNIASGATIPLHVHRVMHESEMVLGDGLLCQGEAAPAGTIFRWPHGAPHRYDNPTTRAQTVLCIDAPPFIPADEVEVAGDPANVVRDARFVRGGLPRT